MEPLRLPVVGFLSSMVRSGKVFGINAAEILESVTTSFLTGRGRMLSPTPLGLVNARVLLQEKPDRPVKLENNQVGV